MIKIFYYPAVFVFSLFIAVNSYGDELRPFKSDGCSNFPDGTIGKKRLWAQCCNAHDYDYWKGGTFKQRKQADLDLKTCVSGVGKPKTSWLMYAGVRFGGSPLYPTGYRWGYGWKYPRFYGALSEVELEKVERLSAIGLAETK